MNSISKAERETRRRNVASEDTTLEAEREARRRSREDSSPKGERASAKPERLKPSDAPE